MPSSPPPQQPSMHLLRKMTRNPNPRLATLLRYTYQANMVFFAGLATWHFLKAPDKKATSRAAPEQAETKNAGLK
jgi:hypothetical protein